MLDQRGPTTGAVGSAAASHHSRAELASHQKLIRLIIADDDPVVASMLNMSLGNEFDVVGVAGDGDATVALAAETRPDAAIIDVDMPKGGGMAAVRGIREASPETAMVILSGDESDHLVRELVAEGAVAYRRKGVDAHVLAESLRDAVDAHAHERQFTTAHTASPTGESSNGAT
jgi:DNA-binding NarL/FixJ family response regulator